MAPMERALWNDACCHHQGLQEPLQRGWGNYHKKAWRKRAEEGAGTGLETCEIDTGLGVKAGVLSPQDLPYQDPASLC